MDLHRKFHLGRGRPLERNRKRPPGNNAVAVRQRRQQVSRRLRAGAPERRPKNAARKEAGSGPTREIRRRCRHSPLQSGRLRDQVLPLRVRRQRRDGDPERLRLGPCRGQAGTVQWRHHRADLRCGAQLLRDAPAEAVPRSVWQPDVDFRRSSSVSWMPSCADEFEQRQHARANDRDRVDRHFCCFGGDERRQENSALSVQRQGDGAR